MGEYEYTVTYSSKNGQNRNGEENKKSIPSSDTEFNNFVVAPVKTKFDFRKALAGRELKAGEFNFVLKDSEELVADLQQDAHAVAGLALGVLTGAVLQPLHDGQCIVHVIKPLPWPKQWESMSS